LQIDGVVPGQVGGGAGAGREHRQGQLAEAGRVAQRAVGDHAGRAAHQQPGGQDVAERRGVGDAAAVDDQHLAGRHLLDGAPLRMVVVLEHRQHVQVLPGRDVAQRERLAGQPAGRRVGRREAVEERAAQPAGQQPGGQRRGADQPELVEQGPVEHGGVK
jgi:hypothetical protein